MAEFIWNQSEVDKKLSTIKSALNSTVGKPGFNPFIWVSDNLTPLIRAIENGDKSEATYKKIMALPDVPRPVAKGAEHNVDRPPLEAQPAGRKDDRNIDPNVGLPPTTI